MGQILLAGIEANKVAALVRDMVAHRPAEHRIANLQRAQDRMQSHRRLDFELNFAGDLCQDAQVIRNDNADHERV